MGRHVAFLRAINVAGHAVVSMADLREAFSSAGCRGVKTYIQSGNVVFDAHEKSLATVLRKVEVAVGALLDSTPVVICRKVEELDGILARNPFKQIAGLADAKCYVTFLRDAPKAWPALPMAFAKEAVEVLAVDHLNLFVVSRPIAPGRYGFPNLPVERQFGVLATSRNWNTLTKVVGLARS